MHGADDTKAKPAEGRRVFEAVSGPKTLKIFEHAGHGSYQTLHPEAWRSEVAGFLSSLEQPPGTHPEGGL